ncbi:MAG: arginine decarboxylase, pyruvoyl-dependent [Planctomycetes bacterium]|nr:arginine decarboxylase, pyruvoyl-dependent [Planctomycetota bacterium]
MVVPKRMFFTKGVGQAKEKLTSFEAALRHAKIAPFNLVKVSSIFPPNCKIVSTQEGLKGLKPGTILYCVMSENSTNEPNRLISAAVGLALPADKSLYGYLSEHHSFGETDEKSGEFAEDLAATMLATTLGIPFDPDQDYNARKDIYLMSKKVVKTRNSTQSARGHKAGLWTSVIAAAVLLLD